MISTLMRAPRRVLTLPIAAAGLLTPAALAQFKPNAPAVTRQFTVFVGDLRANATARPVTYFGGPRQSDAWARPTTYFGGRLQYDAWSREVSVAVLTCSGTPASVSLISSPAPAWVCSGSAGSVVFAASADGGGEPVRYLWEASDPAYPGGWIPLADGVSLVTGFGYSGTASATLTVFPLGGFGLGQSRSFRVTATNSCNSVVSAPAGLTVQVGGYANCDASTASPALNALDFACFLQRFRAGDPYANCDASTSPPTLNALDFACFLNRYQAGCP